MCAWRSVSQAPVTSYCTPGSDQWCAKKIYWSYECNQRGKNRDFGIKSMSMQKHDMETNVVDAPPFHHSDACLHIEPIFEANTASLFPPKRSSNTAPQSTMVNGEEGLAGPNLDVCTAQSLGYG
mmetsp:Transcript_3520/g.8974  ORF Transcript_3520/g.8974 Transcript_3520/m.8974 type:complete len:124 (+) Transcript_3520:707-1078(+)